MYYNRISTVEYFKLLCDIWSARDAIVNPRRFKVALQKFAPQFSGHNQHDCQACVMESFAYDYDWQLRVQ